MPASLVRSARIHYMATFSFVDFSTSATQRLADLSGVAADLLRTQELCDRLDVELQKTPMDALVIEAFSAAALVKYGRIFGSGVRTKIPQEVLSGLPADQLDAHRMFKDLRNKWVAHSVNAFEDNIVVAYLVPPERGDPGVSSIGTQHTRVLSLSQKQVKMLKQLASTIDQKIATLLKDENAKALEYARAVDPATLYDQVDLPPVAPSTTDPSKRRKKFRGE